MKKMKVILLHSALCICFLCSATAVKGECKTTGCIRDKYIGAITDNARYIADDGDILTALTILQELNENPIYSGNKQIEATMRYVLNKYDKQGYNSIAKIYDIADVISPSAISNDGKLIYLSQGDNILIYDIENNCYRSSIHIDSRLFPDLVLSSDGKYILTKVDYNDYVLIDVNSESIYKSFKANKISKVINDGRFHEITSAIISNDNKHVATISGKYLCIWLTLTGEIIYLVDTQFDRESMLTARFSYDGKRIVIWGDKKAIIVDTNSGEIVRTIDVEHQIGTALFDFDASNVMISLNNEISVYNIVTGQIKYTINTDAKVIDAYCIDDNKIAIIDVANQISVITTTYPRIVVSKSLISDDGFETFSPNGKYILCNCNIIEADNNPAYFQVFEYSESESRLQHENDESRESIGYIEYSSNDSLVLVYHKPYFNLSKAYAPGEYEATLTRKQLECKDLQIYNAQPFSKKATLKGHLNKITSATFSRDNKFIATCSLDSTIRIWDARTLSCTQEIKTNEGAIKEVVFNQNGTQVASISDNNHLLLYNIDGSLSYDLPIDSASRLVLSANGKKIYTNENGKIVIRNAKNGKFIKYAFDTAQSKRTTFSKDGKWAITADVSSTNMYNEASIKVWDLDAEKLVNTINIDNCKIISSLELSDKGNTLIVACSDKGVFSNKIMVIDVVSGEILDQLKFPGQYPYVTISSNEETIVAGTSNFIIWNYLSQKSVIDKCRNIIGNHKLSAKEREKYNLD